MVRNSKGITLIALVITIIVLLILAGVSLSLVMGNEGILGKATNAVDKTEKAAVEEELNLAIADLRLWAVREEEKFDKNYITENLPKKLEDCSCELIEDEIEGEYKNYIFTVDENYVVKIESIAGGVKPEITAEVLTKDRVLEGEVVEIQVCATISEGNVTIQVPENMILKSKITETETEKVYVYTTNKNGNYVLTAIGDSGRKKNTTVKVDKIIDKPRINVSDNTGISVVINVENDYPEEVTYTYYLGTEEKATRISAKTLTIDGLTEGAEYTVKVVVNYEESQLISDEVSVTMIEKVTPPITVMTSLEENVEKIALEFPILTFNGVMNCVAKCNIGDKVRIEMENTTDSTNYYSINGGKDWIEYTNIVEIDYPGDELLKGKSMNQYGSSEIKDIKPYLYDSNINCVGKQEISHHALKNEAYDRKYTTYFDADTQNWEHYEMQIDPECWKKYITIYTENVNDYGCISFFKNGIVLVGDYIWKLSGQSNTVLAAKSIKIPRGIDSVGFLDGTAWVTPNYIYEVWCSQENLNGKTY